MDAILHEGKPCLRVGREEATGARMKGHARWPCALGLIGSLFGALLAGLETCRARNLPFGCGLVWPPSRLDLDELMGPGWALKTAEYWAAMEPDLRAKLGQKIELGLGPNRNNKGSIIK